jgi:hypothetical protein
VTGNVYPEVESKLPQYANKTPRAVFRNLGNHRSRPQVQQLPRRTAAADVLSEVVITMETWTF